MILLFCGVLVAAAVVGAKEDLHLSYSRRCSPVSSADGFEDSVLQELGDRPTTEEGLDFESTQAKKLI